MNSCIMCEYYDASVDACNADDKCYTDGYQQGKRDGIKSVNPKRIDECVKQYELGFNQAIDDFSEKAMIEFTKFDLEHGYPTITDIKIVIRDLAKQLKEREQK